VVSLTKYKNKSSICLLLMLLSFAFYTQGFAQCQKSILYYKGKFFNLYYSNVTNKDSIGRIAYLSYDRITEKNIDSLSDKDSYRFEKLKKDSITICNSFIGRYFNGSKWAIYTKQLSDFKYDYAYTYLPKKPDGKYFRYENPYVLVLVGKNWGLVDYSGKELTPVNYKLPEAAGAYPYFIYTCSKPGRGIDSVYNSEFYSQNVIDYPLASDLIVFVKDNKVGAVDTLGKVVIPFNYDTLFLKTNAIQGAREGKRYAITNWGYEINGYECIKPIHLLLKETYTSSEKFSGFYLVHKKGKWGIISGLKDEMIKCLFINDSDFLTFKPYSDTFSHIFLFNKKYFSVEIKSGIIKILDENENDVTLKFVQKFEKEK